MANRTDKQIWDAFYEILENGMDFSSHPEPNQKLVDFGLDDLDEIEFLMNVEDEFGVSIPEEDAKDLHTLQDYFEYLKKRGV